MIIFKIVFSIVAIIIIVMGIRLMYLMYKFEKILKRSCPADDDMKDSEIWRQKEQEILKRDNYRGKYCGGNYKLKVYRKCHEYYTSELAKFPWEYSDDAYVTVCKDCYKLSKEVKAWLPHPLI